MIPTRWKPVVIGTVIGLPLGVMVFDALNTLLCEGARERLLERQIAPESTPLFRFRDGLRANSWPGADLSGVAVCGVFGYATTANMYCCPLACGLGLFIAVSMAIIAIQYLVVDYSDFVASVKRTAENALPVY